MGYLKNIGSEIGSFLSEIRNPQPEIVNVDKNKTAGKSAGDTIVQTIMFRQKEDVQRWRNAIRSAENIYNYDRHELIRIFKDVVLDAHVISSINTRTNKILGSRWVIKNEDGTINEEVTKLLDKSWFYETRKKIHEAIYYGYSLVEFGSIVNNEFVSVSCAPREYIVPETHIVKKYWSGLMTDGAKFTERPYNEWNLWVDTGGFGLLTSAAPYYLWKKNSVGYWSQYNEIFGMPTRIGKTDLEDPTRRKNMANMLKNMGAAAWGLFSAEDSIEMAQATNSGSGNTTFKELAEFCNKELSKLFLGQTMTSEDGSSRAQGEVHERVFESYFIADMMFESMIINKSLIPLLVSHKILDKPYRFEHEFKEDIGILDKIKIYESLLIHFDIDKETILKEFGIEVEEKMDDKGMEVVNKMYNDYFIKKM